MHKLNRDFELQTDHLILAGRLDLVIINKKKRTCQIVDFAVPNDNRVKSKEKEKKDKKLDLSLQENWKIMEHESDGDTVTKGLIQQLKIQWETIG